MATITKVEEIQAWQKARELTRIIYALTNSSKFKKDYVLIEQARKSALSIMSNITEGFGRGTDKQFINFLNIAHGYVAELQTQLYAALDQCYISQENFNIAYKLSEEVSKLIQGLSNYLKRKVLKKNDSWFPLQSALWTLHSLLRTLHSTLRTLHS